jgi:hypothetical protein
MAARIIARMALDKGKEYETICEWSEVEDQGKRMKLNEDHQMMKNRNSINNIERIVF